MKNLDITLKKKKENKKELYPVIAAVFTISMLTDTHTQKDGKLFLF